jgi:outer membrane protein
MSVFRRKLLRVALIVRVALMLAGEARAENLAEAWSIALTANRQLEASRQTAIAAGLDLVSSRAERLPQIQTLNLQTFMTNPISVPGSNGQPKAAPGGQQNFTISGVGAIVPIYTGGRIRNTIDSNKAIVNATRADEVSTALDLKLTVARAYVDVLRCNRGVTVAESSVGSLTAQAHDVASLVRQGRGIRNDLLAAQVARANAQQRQIQARNRLSIAWAAYNRYLCRPLDSIVPLEELARDTPSGNRDQTADLDALADDTAPIVVDEAQIQALFSRALSQRSELASLSEQARSTHAQAGVERAKTLPQVSFLVANLYQNARFLPTEADTGVAAFLLNWTIFDGGRNRRHALAMEERAAAQISQRDDLASQIKLQVRSSWLTEQETLRRIPVARAAIVQAEENLRVARGRYVQQRGTNTEVLDAENSRVQSYDNYYNALYDAILANFDLRRAVGDL